MADAFLGKYLTIIILSLVYCLGHGCLAFMGFSGDTKLWLIGGLTLIAIGSGGIKPCVSSHVGDQFSANNKHLLSNVFGWFYFSINLGAFLSGLLTPFLLEAKNSINSLGGEIYPYVQFLVDRNLKIKLSLALIMHLVYLNYYGSCNFVLWFGRKDYAHIPPAELFILKKLLR